MCYIDMMAALFMAMKLELETKVMTNESTNCLCQFHFLDIALFCKDNDCSILHYSADLTMVTQGTQLMVHYMTDVNTSSELHSGLRLSHLTMNENPGLTGH